MPPSSIAQVQEGFLQPWRPPTGEKKNERTQQPVLLVETCQFWHQRPPQFSLYRPQLTELPGIYAAAHPQRRNCCFLPLLNPGTTIYTLQCRSMILRMCPCPRPWCCHLSMHKSPSDPVSAAGSPIPLLLCVCQHSRLQVCGHSLNTHTLDPVSVTTTQQTQWHHWNIGTYALVLGITTALQLPLPKLKLCGPLHACPAPDSGVATISCALVPQTLAPLPICLHLYSGHQHYHYVHAHTLDLHVKMDPLGHDMPPCRGKGKESRRIPAAIITEEHSSPYYCDGHSYSWLLRTSTPWLTLISANERPGAYTAMLPHSQPEPLLKTFQILTGKWTSRFMKLEHS